MATKKKKKAPIPKFMEKTVIGLNIEELRQNVHIEVLNGWDLQGEVHTHFHVANPGKIITYYYQEMKKPIEQI